ncbi:MAG: serine hydrolase [Rhodothermales bacterium]|nr:serine hydrolase [Rhodothermales bacterium]
MRPLLTFALLILCSCQATPRRAGLDESLERIDRFVHTAYEVGASAGLGVGVAVDGRVEYVSNLGMADISAGIPATGETLWYVASTSKSFTGFGIALLATSGEIDVAAPITTYLPNAEWPEGVDPDSLTVGDFLGHTHGMGNGALVISAAFTGAFPESEYGRLLQFNEVGSRELRYSNLGYNVASMVIDAVRPEGWKTFLEHEVYNPAGMGELYSNVSSLDSARIAKPHRARIDGTYYTIPFVKRDITMNAAGGHLGSIESLTRWTVVQMDGGRIDGRQVFPEKAVALSHEILSTHDRQFAFFQRDGWGMGWDVGSYGDEPMVSRFGGYSRTRSHLSFLPDQRLGVVAQVNGPGGSALTDIIAAYVYDVMMDRPDADSLAQTRLEEVRSQVAEVPEQVARFEAVQQSRLNPYPRPLSDYAGTYADDALGSVRFEHVRDTLRMHWGVLEGPTTVFDADSHQLRFSLFGSGAVATFAFDGDGPADRVELFGRELMRQR